MRSILPNARISVEVEKPGRQGLEELAAQVDVVFYSKAWAEVSRQLLFVAVVELVIVTRQNTWLPALAPVGHP